MKKTSNQLTGSTVQQLSRIQKIILITIFILAALLRLWKLNTVPPELTPDEASLGYNAYSILKTGRDEYGELLPVIFKSFGDYKPGLYVYTAVPFIAVFGLNEWSVRLPSAIAGLIIIWLIYKIILLVSAERSQKLSGPQFSLPIFAALAASVNPWLIYFSRGAWEANLSLMLTLGGIYFFIKGIKHSTSYFLITTVLLFGSTFTTYQGAKLSTAIVVILLLAIYRRKFWEVVKVRPYETVLSGIIAIIICLPIVTSLFTGKAGRLEVFSIFSYPRPAEYIDNFLEQGGEKIGDLNYYMYHSETLNLSRGVIGRWFNHLSGRFLFFEGDYQNPKHSAPYSGMMLLVDLLLLPLGFLCLIRTRKVPNKFKYFLFLWLVLSPLPAALSRDEVQAVRALNLSIPLVVISGLGIYYLIFLTSQLKKSYFKGFFFGSFALLFLGSLIYFLDSYFVHHTRHNSKHLFYGYKEAVKEVLAINSNYEKVIFQQSYSQPYIYFLFFGKYDPGTYQSHANLKSGGIDVGLVEKLDNISFESYSWPPPIRSGERTLIVGDSNVVPMDAPSVEVNLLKEIKYPDGVNAAFRILETDNND